ncbi:MAG: hypothetical protein V4598_11545 [Bdellovibrionota bacterium]
MKKTIALTALVLATSLQAKTSIKESTLGSIEISDVSSKMVDINPDPTTPATPAPAVPAPTFNDRVQQVGGVISVAKDVVALGEAIYALVEKGRPKVTTEYAPIDIVPRDPSNTEADPAKKYAVSMFDMEGFSLPQEKLITAKIKTPTGGTAVEFKYKVIYSYGGSYNGVGKYLAGINIIPASVKVSHGWTLNSTMKLTGMLNHGTRVDPIVGAMITVKYSISSMTQAFERNDTIYISGDGSMKAMISN